MEDVSNGGRTGNVAVPKLRMVHVRSRQVHEQHAEGDADKQQRLEFLDEAKIEQEQGDNDHDELSPVGYD